MSGARDGLARRPSLLGPGLELKGDINSDAELVILGCVSGRRLQAPVITIGPAAKVRAEIWTDSIRIEGVVIGDIHAKVAVIVQANATVRGVIRSPSITLREGAIVNGGANVENRKRVRLRESSPSASRALARRA